MTATYTFDVFSSLDGYASHNGRWGAYWGKQGPELLGRRLSLYSTQQRVVLGPPRSGSSRGSWPQAPGSPASLTPGSPR